MEKIKKDLNLRIFAIIITVFLAIGYSSCKTIQDNTIQTAETIFITENEVLEAQKAWGEGIVNIGKVYFDNGDYREAAAQHINNFYNYKEGSVLFKPTLASQQQFRCDFQGALSYFVGGDESYPEDHGFAIKPWSSVRWENSGIQIIGNMAIAMGNYYFTPAKGGDDVKVEYSFAYTKDKEGRLKIILHGSHIPFLPEK